ncbi:MAG TPA: transposase [Tepidisphaeraceae bacterium]|nr:transposase [Tepidisphaeraceae bacterium]
MTAARADPATLEKARPGRRRRPEVLLGDKGYSYRFARAYLWSVGVRPLIPRRKDQANEPGRRPWFDRTAYKGRNVIERCVNRLKAFRAVATRYDKLARSDLAQVDLAMIKICFRELRDRT